MDAPVTVAVYVGQNCWGGLALLAKEAFAIAGTLHARSGDLQASARFHVRLAALDRSPVQTFTGPHLQPECTLDELPHPQVIILPPVFFADDARATLPPMARAWLAGAYGAGALVLCMASGARLLAETGLLDGREATGNLSDLRSFERHYPQVRFLPDMPLVIDGRLVSAASINPCMDACTYIVSQFIGEAAAHKFSRYTNSVTQPTYERLAMRNAGLKQHADQRVKQAQEFIERSFTQDISVEDAARRAAMSLRNFSRRFQLAVGMAPHLYIARCRAEHAKELLAQPSLPVLQVALRSGFRNEVMLRRAFSQLFGTTPTAWRAAHSPDRYF